MKKILITLLFILICNTPFAQNSGVTQFMGIDVDGTKTEMIQKLKQKGFVYNSTLDVLEGEFNGKDVYIMMSTNKNKMHRIYIHYYDTDDESYALTQYNKLFDQFYESSKYTLNYGAHIKQSENIEYEMRVNYKTYGAIFLQDNDNMKPVYIILSRFGYKDYSISICYDNPYNKPNGQDL